MVVFNIFFEPVQKFNERITELDNYVSFNEALIKWTQGIRLEDIVEPLLNKDICIFKMDSYSLSTSLVFENIDLLIKIFTEAEIKDVYIHNPPKRFFKSLKQQVPSEILKVEQSSFEKISEEQLKSVSKDLNEKIIGQEKAKKSILRKLVAQLVRPSEKPLVLMFYGEPGIGKTETAKQLSETLYGNENVIREQMSMVGGESSVKYFKSTNHSEDSFSKTLLNRESNVILLDEFALAPAFFHSTFFQMFDEGVYEDQNYKVDLKNSIIICTSNFKSLLEMEKNIDIALLSRFDGFVKFYPLSIDEKRKILKITYSKIISSESMTKNYQKYLKEDEILAGIEAQLNNLPNVRAIRKYVEDVVAEELLEVIINGKSN
ncbi:AAA family ATPase [Streptococcus salivarius]|uniref:AAA family ATPase n=1 Tax=Streptococcus salivarius TaxID=1304 RepID=UPI001581E52D|nr:AAA family ATPase [Streptococcus salivarius]